MIGFCVVTSLVSASANHIDRIRFLPRRLVTRAENFISACLLTETEFATEQVQGCDNERRFHVTFWAERDEVETASWGHVPVVVVDPPPPTHSWPSRHCVVT